MSGTNKAILSMSVLLIAALVVYYGMTPPESAKGGSVDLPVQNQPKARLPVFGGDPTEKFAELGIPLVATAIATEKVEKVAVWHPIPVDPEPVTQESTIAVAEPIFVETPMVVVKKTYKLYTVLEDETLGRIAERELGSYRMWRKIAALNNITDPDVIRQGMVLRMPEATVAVPSTPVLEPANPVLRVFHIVVKDDTFSSIAGYYLDDDDLYRIAIYAERIAEVNPNVDPDRMRIGSRIVIPKR